MLVGWPGISRTRPKAANVITVKLLAVSDKLRSVLLGSIKGHVHSSPAYCRKFAIPQAACTAFMRQGLNYT